MKIIDIKIFLFNNFVIDMTHIDYYN